MSYSEKLKDPRWQRKRLEIMQRDLFVCSSCGNAEATLHVHHDYYVKGREPWDYPSFALKTLCADCHDEQHSDPSVLMGWEVPLAVILTDPVCSDLFYDISTQIKRLKSHGFDLMDILTKLSTLASELDEQKAEV